MLHSSLKLNKRWTDERKVIYLLQKKQALNDIIGAKRYNIFFVHQRVSELRRKGWQIESVKNEDGTLKTYRLIQQPLFN